MCREVGRNRVVTRKPEEIFSIVCIWSCRISIINSMVAQGPDALAQEIASKEVPRGSRYPTIKDLELKDHVQLSFFQAVPERTCIS